MPRACAVILRRPTRPPVLSARPPPCPRPAIYLDHALATAIRPGGAGAASGDALGSSDRLEPFDWAPPGRDRRGAAAACLSRPRAAPLPGVFVHTICAISVALRRLRVLATIHLATSIDAAVRDRGSSPRARRRGGARRPHPDRDRDGKSAAAINVSSYVDLGFAYPRKATPPTARDSNREFSPLGAA